MKRLLFLIPLLLLAQACFCWGFYGHRKINYLAVFLLPPEMLSFFKENIEFLSEHAVDPDKRRYAIPEEGPRHYIDIDYYGKYPFPELPRNYDSAVAKFSADTVNKYGIVPWWVQTMLARLTSAFRDKNQARILKLSAEIGHYISDAHVPLHATHNHNGQYTGQNGIHGFWESRVPELLADRQFDFWIGKAAYIKNPGEYIWARVLESATAADTVLLFERELTRAFPSDLKYSYENRNGTTIRQYSTAFTVAYNDKLTGMVERRMRQSVHATASFWYTAWVNAGQPDLKNLSNKSFSADELKEFEQLDEQWKKGKVYGKDCN
ncbi:MAG TPA: zinc dependent phospholipase C family protein [Lacibacter sp.]|nr:zinc dependent phospholipase C family protein [Lacibacter sp.]HMO88184.1 zinc dependent phospholipase C family protein [Lacibacter sp.]HMP86213.1 zinc dependent phospholipase C family protein [Lacibacter sp.]